MKLTKAAVERAWRSRGATRQILRDEQTKGLALVVNAASAAWTLSYKPRGIDEHGRRWSSRHIKLGGLDTLDLDGARAAAGSLKAKVAAGGDPARDQAASIAALTLRRRTEITVAQAAALTLTWLQTGLSAKTGRPRSPGYLHDARRYMARIADVLGPQVPIEGAAWGDLEVYLEELPAAQRVQAKANARAMVMRMVKLGHLMLDPLAGRWPAARTAQRDRTPSPAEIAQLLRAADALADLGRKPSIAPVWRDVLYVIALTGCRRAEAATMRVEHVDLATRVWRQPSIVNKSRREHAIPLGQLSAEIVGRAVGERTAGLVFPGRVGTPLSGWSRLWTVVTAKARVQGTTIHDCRRALVSAVADAGAADVATLDRLLNHAAAATAGGVIATYQRASMLEPMRRAVDAWENILGEHLGRQRCDNVLTFPASAGASTPRKGTDL